MDRNDTAAAVGWLLILLLASAVLRPVCSPKVVVPPDPNEELARTAREAVEMAQAAREDAAAVRASSDRWYFVSLAAAVVAPLVLAWLLFRFYAETPPDDAEVWRRMQRILDHEQSALPPPHRKPLAAPPEQDGSAHRRNHT